MANMRSFCFIIAFHNFATLENRLIYQWPSSWPVVITMKTKLAGTWKSYRILAGPNEWQQVCNRSNLEKTGRNCEGVNFSWFSSKISRTLKWLWPIWNSQSSCTNYMFSRMFCILREVDAKLKMSIEGLLALVLYQDPKASVSAHQFDKYKGIQIEHIYILRWVY